jgi:hypothetical protein
MSLLLLNIFKMVVGVEEKVESDNLKDLANAKAWIMTHKKRKDPTEQEEEILFSVVAM